MPWYVTIILFLLSPAYAIVVRDRLWPRAQDWWAIGSRHRLQIRISKLEGLLESAKLLQAHTDVEHRLFLGLHALFLLVGMGVHLILGAMFYVLAVFRPILLATYGEIVVVKLELVFLVTLVLNGVFLVGIVYGFQRYWQPRSEAWRLSIENELTTLRAKLQ